jgi:hypothetical protein
MQRAPRRRARGPDRRTVIKDIVSFALAWALIWFLALYGVDGPIAWGLLGLAGGLLGIPVAGGIRGKSEDATGMDGSDSPSPSVDSSPS